MKAGKYEFKFTQGAWENSECDSNSFGIFNRTITINKDTTVHPLVQAWLDGYFDMRQLNDSLRNEAMMGRAGYFLDVNLDSSYAYAVQLYEISKRVRSASKEARALGLQAIIFTRQGNGQKAIELLFKALEIHAGMNRLQLNSISKSDLQHGTGYRQLHRYL